MAGEPDVAILHLLFQNLNKFLTEEISLNQGLKIDAEKLTENLAMSQSFLDDAQNKFITDESVKSWLRKLEAVAFDADNVLDELNYHVLSEQGKTMETEKKKVPSCFPCFNRIVHRQQMDRRIKTINMAFTSINSKATLLGLERKLENAPVASVARLETSSLDFDPIFIGRENDVSEIVEILISQSNTEQVFSIIPIVGMGGLGKTTLTRNVFNHERIKYHFDIRIWVNVAKSFDTTSLLKKILTTLEVKFEAGSRVDGWSREEILIRLQVSLQSTRFLLVIDDVWQPDRLKWEGFMNSLLGITSTTGNGIIVTTRITEVASIVKTLYIHKLNGLAEEECWFIIKERAFEGGHIPSGIETIGRNIAKRCQGLPLAASVVGGMLRGKSIDDWLSIQQNWLSNEYEDNMSKILKLSYDNLASPSLKKCFAYCSIFPKGHQIDKQNLIELWMAQGFLQSDQANDMEAIGSNCLSLLLRSSLLQVAQRENNGDVTHCNMHDLVHDLACSLSNSKVNEDLDGIYPAQYIKLERDGSLITRAEAKCLRTLFFNGAISDTIFPRFKSLHALTLTGNDVEELPSSIWMLIHLRYLNILDTRILCLPDSIGKLHHLQTFRAGYSLKKLPSTFKYLISLRHLHIHVCTKFPDEIGRLTSLRTLRYFPIGEEKGQQIVELGNLKNLRGELEICNLEKVPDKEEAQGAHLFEKPNIVKLVLCWNESREGEPNDEKVLEGLQPHPNLKSLHIKGFKGPGFPLWTLKMAVRDEVEGRWLGLDNLTEITLDGCTDCEEIPMLGHLPLLKFLDMKKLTKVRSIGYSFYGIDKYDSKSEVWEETIIVFPALERLSFSDMPSLIEWVEIVGTQPREVEAFPRLEKLEIFSCEQLKSAPSHFSCLKELNISGMDSGLPLANICGRELTSLTKLKISGLDDLECLPDRLFYDNKNLRELAIAFCLNLRELPDGLHTLDSLEELSIYWCPRFKSLPSSSGGRSYIRLRSLSIKDCEELINLPWEMMESSALSLERLMLKNLSSVKKFSMVIDSLRNMSRLAELEIDIVPQFISTTSTEIGNWVRSLQELRIGPSLDSRDCDSLMKTVDGILKFEWNSLRRLHLKGMEDWGSLPYQLQHLSSLSELKLENFGIEKLPEWFRNLRSLTFLSLLGCKKLRSMPSKEAMQRLTKLDELRIHCCPLLEKRCIEQEDDDSEWPKISHIHHVVLDRHHFYSGKKMDQAPDKNW